MAVRKCSDDEYEAIEAICLRFDNLINDMLAGDTHPDLIVSALSYLVSYVLYGSLCNFDLKTLEARESDIELLTEDVAEAVDRAISRETERN